MPIAPRTDARRLFELEDPPEDRHRVGIPRPAYIRQSADFPRPFGRGAADRLSGQLLGDQGMHRSAGCSDRMALGVEAARQVYRTFVLVGRTPLRVAVAGPAVFREPERFGAKQLGDGKAVVRLAKAQLFGRDGRLPKGFPDGVRGTHQLFHVWPKIDRETLGRKTDR